MIDRAHPTLSISRQCHLLEVSRAAVYRRPAPVSADDLRLMELIDRQYLACPFYGSRRMAAWLATQGHTVNRKRVQRLMRLMGLVAIHQRPNTSKAAPEHTKYPYLLGGLTIDRVNQVWCSDITYIPLARGFISHHCSRNRLGKVFISSCARKRGLEFCRCLWRSAVGFHGIRNARPEGSNELGGQRVPGCVVRG